MRNRKLYLGLIFCMALVIICLLDVRVQSKGVALGNVVAGNNDKPAEWQNIIATDINQEDIRLLVDGSEITLNNQKLFMDQQRNIFIPVSILRDVFQCAVNSFSEDEITLQKGNTVVSAESGKSNIMKNDENVDTGSPFVYLDHVAYLNAKVMELGFDYSYLWDSSHNMLKLTNQKKVENMLPSVYSYRQVGRLSRVKNQGTYSTCWAFASLSALETSVRPWQNLTFSPDNMALNNGYSVSQNEGGDYTRAIAYLTSWKGPVLEQDDPYGDGKYNPDAKAVKHVQEVQIIESKNLEAIKKAVFLHGGVESSLYTSMSYTDETSMFYNKKKNAYCYIGTKKPNHDVVIVGWDDNYSKDNFNAELEGDGAFLCMNSWGSEFGDQGLFYVSYYDSNIGIHNVVYTGIEDTDNYDKIYQSDLCGWIGQMGYDSDSAFFSNVYKAESNEELEAVGFYATDKNTSYELYYVDNFTDESSFEGKVLLQTGTFDNSGYYTVKLNEPIALTAGVRYAIVIKILTPDSVHPIAIEYRAGRATQDVILDDGEGYISLTGKSWEHVEESKNCNICLKMYTKIQENQQENLSVDNNS